MLASRPSGMLATDLIDSGNLQSAWNALRDQPPQAAEPHGPATPEPVPNVAGRIEATVAANGTSLTAVSDTGAGMGAVSEGLARRLQPKPLPRATKIEGAAQVSADARMAMPDTPRMGSAVLRHGPVTIVPDRTSVVGPPGGPTRQIDMFVGFSEMRALHRMTIAGDGTPTFNTAAPPAPIEGRLLEQGFIPILQAPAGGVSSNFPIDCGADVTSMNSSVLRQAPAAFSGLAESNMQFSAVGGARQVRRFVLPRLTLRLERGAVSMHDVTAFAAPGEINFAGLVGNIGRDFCMTAASRWISRRTR